MKRKKKKKTQSLLRPLLNQLVHFFPSLPLSSVGNSTSVKSRNEVCPGEMKVDRLENILIAFEEEVCRESFSKSLQNVPSAI